MGDRLVMPLEDPGLEAEEIEVQDDDEQDVEQARQAHSPPQPTDQEMESHRCDHHPYRSWCKFCVMGRGRGFPHGQGQDSAIPVIGMDYFFITSGGVKKRDELRDSDTQNSPEALSEGAC